MTAEHHNTLPVVKELGKVGCCQGGSGKKKAKLRRKITQGFTEELRKQLLEGVSVGRKATIIFLFRKAILDAVLWWITRGFKPVGGKVRIFHDQMTNEEKKGKNYFGG